MLNFILCDIDITSTPFCNLTIIAYELELLPVVKEMVSIYWMIMILSSHILLIQLITHQPVIKFQHRLRIMCGSQLPTEKNPSQKKGHFMNYITIIINVENTKSRSGYIKGKPTSTQILKNLGPDLIKLDLWFPISKFVSQKSL